MRIAMTLSLQRPLDTVLVQIMAWLVYGTNDRFNPENYWIWTEQLDLHETYRNSYRTVDN